ncbi:MAG TPA: S8 family serine peptidase [Sphingomonas sp.]|nr:S8 family serine peptidase [Sphingomonas sp.]
MTAVPPWVRRFALAALGVLVLLAQPASDAVAQPARPPSTSADREILVMLRLTPDHYRPNAAYGGGYGGGVTASIRRRAAARIARHNRLTLVGNGWPMPVLGLDCYVMRVPDGVSIETAIAEVSRDPAVSWSQPMQVYHAQGGGPAADDPLFAAQPDARLWHLANLHRIATGRGVTVAVIDSRVDTTHPDLKGQFVASQDFVTGHPNGPERHGTGIAGVIAAKAGNGIGIAGVAPDARLMALRACWQTGAGAAAPTLCDTLSLARAMLFAIDHHADIINMSLSGPDDRLLERLVNVALQRRIAVVAAFDPTLAGGGFPASMPRVIAVADEDMASLPAGVYGAPARDVPTTQPGGKWFLVNGSSYAAAHVSGLLALVRQNHGAEARATLIAARSTGGAIDACATLLGRADPCHCACPPGEVASAAR